MKWWFKPCVLQRGDERNTHIVALQWPPKTRRCGEVKVGKIKTGKNPFIIWHQTFHHAETVPMADIKMLQFYIYNGNVHIQSNSKSREMKGRTGNGHQIPAGTSSRRAPRLPLCVSNPRWTGGPVICVSLLTRQPWTASLCSSFKTKMFWTLKAIEARGAVLPSFRLAQANLVQDETTAFI